VIGPSLVGGRRLLAHRLTHVVQQGQASVKDRLQRQDNGGDGGEKSDAKESSTPRPLRPLESRGRCGRRARRSGSAFSRNSR
jgi:hypothetical protein